MFLSEWREFPSPPCLAGKKKNLTARVSMLLKSRASLTCFRSCFLPGRPKDLSVPRYYVAMYKGRIAGKLKFGRRLGPIVGLWTSEETNLFTQCETWHTSHNVKVYFAIFWRGQNLLHTRTKHHSFALYKMQWCFQIYVCSTTKY